MDVDLMEMKTQKMVGQRFSRGDHAAKECGMAVGADNGRKASALLTASMFP